MRLTPMAMALLYYCTSASKPGGQLQEGQFARRAMTMIRSLRRMVEPGRRVATCLLVAAVLMLWFGCDAERRKSDAELGLNPQQAAGRRVYDRHCDQCHEPYSTSGRRGPGLKGVC